MCLVCWAVAEGEAKPYNLNLGGGGNALRTVLSKTTFGGLRNQRVAKKRGGGNKDVSGEGFTVCVPPLSLHLPWSLFEFGTTTVNAETLALFIRQAATYVLLLRIFAEVIPLRAIYVILFQVGMHGDTFSIKAPKECSKKFAAILKGKFLTRGNVLRIYLLLLEDFAAPL